MAQSLSHKIGSIVNSNDIYSDKYKKEAKAHLFRAKEYFVKEHWNYSDLLAIKSELRKRLEKELYKKEHIDKRKFDIMDEEIEKGLKDLEIGLP